MGWFYYDTPPAPLTLEQQLTALTSLNKSALIDAYTFGKDYSTIKHEIGLSKHIVNWWIGTQGIFNQIRDKSIEYLKGKIEGVNAPTANKGADLLTLLFTDFGGSKTPANLTNAEIEFICVRMLQYSKRDGTGDWAYFIEGVINNNTTGVGK